MKKAIWIKIIVTLIIIGIVAAYTYYNLTKFSQPEPAKVMTSPNTKYKTV